MITEEMIRSMMSRVQGGKTEMEQATVLGLMFSVLEESFPEAFTFILLKYPEVAAQYTKIHEQCKREEIRAAAEKKMADFRNALSAEEEDILFGFTEMSKTTVASKAGGYLASTADGSTSWYDKQSSVSNILKSSNGA